MPNTPDHRLTAFIDKAKDLEATWSALRWTNPTTDTQECKKLIFEFRDGLRQLREQSLRFDLIAVEPEAFKQEGAVLSFAKRMLREGPPEKLRFKAIVVALKSLKPDLIGSDLHEEDGVTDLFEEYWDAAPEEVQDEVSQLLGISDLKIDESDIVVSNEFYANFSGGEYIENKILAGSIIVRLEQAPEHLERVVSEIRECFAFQRYIAVAILCRTAIEIVLRDIYSKKGFESEGTYQYEQAQKRFRRLKGVDHLREYIPTLFDMESLVCSLPAYKHMKSQIAEVRTRANSIVHGHTVPSKDKATELMRTTQHLMHELYAV